MAGMKLKSEIVGDMLAARGHLQHSFRKANNMKLDGAFSEEDLEALESFTSRFARYSDLVIMKYFKLLALEKDPAFRGSVIDILNLAEKYGWISSSQTWRRIREMRNFSAHEYSPEAVLNLIPEFLRLSEELFQVRLDL